MTDVNGTTHLADGDLIRHLHQELAEAEWSEVAAHLEECADCRSRLAGLAAGAREVSRLFAEGVPATPRKDWVIETRRRLQGDRGLAVPGRFRLAAAIAFLVLAGGAVTVVSPLRAWVGNRLADVLSLGGETREQATAVPEPEGTASLEFDPQSAEFIVRIEYEQSVGQLTVEFTDANRATVEILGGADEQILLLPDGLTIQNTPTSSASYRLVLPRGVRSTQVLAGGDSPVQHELSASFERTWVLDLGAAETP